MTAVAKSSAAVQARHTLPAGNLLSAQQFKGFPTDKLLSDATRLAKGHIADPQIQRIEFSSHNGKPAMLVSFHNKDQSQWFAARLSKDGKTLWEDSATGLAKGKLPLTKSASNVSISVDKALAKAFKDSPQAEFNMASLVPLKRGGFEYHVWNSADWKTQPTMTIDVASGKMKVETFNAATGKPETARIVK